MQAVRIHSSSGVALPAGVEVFRLDLDLAQDPEASGAWRLITPQEQSRAARFVQRADRVRFSAARAALRELLAPRLGCAPLGVAFGTGAHGKPFVANAGDVQGAPRFNVAHSGRHALIALADAACMLDVGVDIERIDAGIELQGMARMVFTPRECAAIDAAADPLDAFFLRWSGKEAVLKAIGVGITEHLQSIDLQPGGPHGLELDTSIAGWTTVRAAVLEAPAGYAAALAWQPAGAGSS